MTQGCLLKHIQNFSSICGDTENCFQHLQVQAGNHNQWLCWQGWKSPLHLPIALWDWFHPSWSFYRWWVNVSLLWNLVIRSLKSTASLFFLYSSSMHARLYKSFIFDQFYSSLRGLRKDILACLMLIQLLRDELSQQLSSSSINW